MLLEILSWFSSNSDYKVIQFSSVQSLSRVRTPWTAVHQASLSITNSQSSLKLMSIKSVMPSSHLILCHPLLLLPPIPPSIRVFSNESALRIRWPKYWSFSFSIIPPNEYSVLISLRMDWLDLLAVQGTQDSSPTPQFKSINSSALSFLHSPTLTSIHDHRENHSLVVIQSLSRAWLCDPMHWSTPVFPVLHYLLEFAQTHVHWVSDAT